jgi:hypothetical protein
VFAHTSLALAVVALGASGNSSLSGWKHVSVHRHEGTIDATLSYEMRPPEYRRVTLVVRRAGKVVIEDHRYPVGTLGRVRSLTLRNVWGSNEPEAFVEIWTGGNRCCDRLEVGLISEGDRPRVLLHDFPVYTGVRGRWHDGAFDFLSADNHFDCAFTACANASQPIQIFTIDKRGRRFADVTRSRPDLIAADAAALWKEYLRERAEHSSNDPVGVLAPWCADQYSLARKRKCDRALAYARAHGYLDGWHRGIQGWVKGGRAIIDLLRKRLAAWGYDRS